ncbi:MAG: DUF72 domain-containing protein [Acidobacteria bacterium]|nr:DUF72 domain-containing protein [Acidobacteriota bacterium]
MIRLGTSAFTAAGWPGTFYPKGMKSPQYLTHYAEQFDAVEIDSTFYGTPSMQTVSGWATKTPESFIFAAKVPRAITHEKVLVGCQAEFERFVDTMDCLGDKLGPLLLQFPYFNKKKFAAGGDFLERLAPFVERLPKGYKFAVEIRNKNWLSDDLTKVLKKKNVALALIDHPWMPRPAEVFKKIDPITADFTYIRFLGDRHGIEEQTKTWNKTIVNRKRELKEWAEILEKKVPKKIVAYVFANNHYAGHAPDTVRQFAKMVGVE